MLLTIRPVANAPRSDGAQEPPGHANAPPSVGRLELAQFYEAKLDIRAMETSTLRRTRGYLRMVGGRGLPLGDFAALRHATGRRWLLSRSNHFLDKGFDAPLPRLLFIRASGHSPTRL
jgi:hypothetical protein